jgi:hypothetical protein
MKSLSVILVPLLLASGLATLAQDPGSCPTNAVFLALTDSTNGVAQVRGYSTRANGPTAPCQVLRGSQTTFSTVNGVAISIHGLLHVVQFLTNGTVDVFAPGASGNVAPERIESTETNDLLAVASDAHVTDFVLSRRNGPAVVVVIPPGATLPEGFFDAPGFDLEGGGLAIDTDNNLIVGGYALAPGTNPPVYNALIETMGTSVNPGTPAVVRQLAGPKTGIFQGSFEGSLSNNQLSLAVDPVSGELYVYNYSFATGRRQISVFPARASGNVAPERVIGGSATQIGPPGELNNKIAVSADGRLFVAEANNRILVFAPGVSGNVAPAQIISDSTIGSATEAQGGIGVRYCQCK